MISRWISLVPSPMIMSGVSRYSRSTPDSTSWFAGPAMSMRGHGGLLGVLGGEELRHAGLEVAALLPVLHPRRPVGDEPRALHADRDVGQCRRRRPAASGRPLRRLERGLGHAHCARRDVDPPRLEPGHHVLEAAPLDAADEVRRGAGEGLELELGGVHALVAELGDRLDHREARMPLLHDEAGHAAVARRGGRIGEGEQRERVALAAVGDEHLRAGDQVAVAVAAGHGADGLYVGARVGLGEAEPAPGEAGGEARQEPRALLVGAVVQHDERGHRVAVDDAGQGHPAPAELLDHARVGRDVDAEPAVLARDQRAEQLELVHAGDQVVRVGVGVVEARGDRLDLGADELAHRRHHGMRCRRSRRRGACSDHGWSRVTGFSLEVVTSLANAARALQARAPRRPPEILAAVLRGPYADRLGGM